MMDLPISLAGLLWCALAVYLSWRFIVYPAFLSPLSNLPNAHSTASISPAWVLYVRLTGQGNKSIHEAHSRLGPIVRLSPSEVSINCVEGGIKTVYGGGFPKHDWYPRVFGSYGTFSMFATTSNHLHSARKRMLTNIYSKSYLNDSLHLKTISNTIIHARLLPIIDHLASNNTTCNVHDLNQAFAMDFVSSYLFGLHNGTNFLEDEETRASVLSAYFSRKPFDVFFQEVPNLTAWATYIGIPLIPKWREKANQTLNGWGASLCERAESDITSTDLDNEPLVYKRLRGAMMKMGDNSLAANEWMRKEISCELLDHLTAGFETSAVALTYAIWELSKNKHLQSQLQQELLSLSPQISHTVDHKIADLPSSRCIDALSLLDAVVTETLRLHAPIPGAQPREVPSATLLAGAYLVPAGTRISAQGYSLHRNPDVFPDPESWLPSRWTRPGSTSDLTTMRQWFWAFGSGGRMCVGSNLALQEIKLMLASIYTHYSTSIVDDNGIEAIDAYTVKPRSNKLVIQFSRV